MHTTANIPCHIVAGPLGVGKTSAILHYLREHAAEQRVGVLVNDFGPVGIDSTTLQNEASQTAVLNVPGGCICCTMLAELPGCILRLKTEQNIDRIIIEPSGMATPSQVIDVLRQGADQLGIDLRPSIVMLSAVHFDEETYERMHFYQMFCEAADILVFNRIDQASEKKINAAKEWAAKLDPPKLRVITTTHGKLPSEIFDLTMCSHDQHDHCDHHHDHSHEHHDHDHDEHHHHDHDHHHHHDHDHEHAHDPTIHPGGFILDADQTFDEDILLVNLMRICHQGIAGNQILRLKGIFHTHDGWQAIEIADRQVSLRPSTHRRDNRMEWISQPVPITQDQVLTELTRPLDLKEMV